MAKIVVVGSANTDMVVKAERLPGGGETVMGGDFAMVPGGKGANQAVCAAKLGADVTFVARLGDDLFADASMESFWNAAIDTRHVVRDPSAPSGVALIMVDSKGENSIVVAPGANMRVTPADVDGARDAIAEADALVLQLEIPTETVVHAIETARSLDVRVVLNPAPMHAFPVEILRKVDVLILNQHEAAELLGRMGQGADLNPEEAAADLRKLGVECVVVTLGSAGAYASAGDAAEYVPAVKVRAVDTTAAGDAFTASFACALADGGAPLDAARFAAKVSAITVTRMGAQPSMPTRAEVDTFTGA